MTDLELDPALGVPSFDEGEVLRRASQGIDCHGNQRLDPVTLAGRLERAAQMFDGPHAYRQSMAPGLKARFVGVKPELAYVQWLTNGFTLSDPFYYGGPENFAPFGTLAAWLANEKQAAASGGQVGVVGQ